MLDRQPLQGLGAVRELRPAEDLSLMRPDELRATFEIATVASLKLIETPRAEESFRLVGAPLASAPPAGPDGVPPAKGDAPIAPSESAARMPAALTEPAPKRLAEAEPGKPPPMRMDVPSPSEGRASTAGPLPYGFDPARVRELVDGLIDIRAASAMTLVSKAAGDLNDVPSEVRDAEARLRIVAPSERAAV